MTAARPDSFPAARDAWDRPRGAAQPTFESHEDGGESHAVRERVATPLPCEGGDKPRLSSSAREAGRASRRGAKEKFHDANLAILIGLKLRACFSKFSSFI